MYERCKRKLKNYVMLEGFTLERVFSTHSRPLTRLRTVRNGCEHLKERS